MTYQEAADLLHDSGERVLIRRFNGKTESVNYWDAGINDWSTFCQVDDEDNISPEAERDLLDVVLKRVSRVTPST